MSRPTALACWSWSAPMVFVLGSAGSAVAVLGPARVPSPVDFALSTALLLPSVLTGCLLAMRVPASPIGGALAWVGAAPAAVFAVERWGRALATERPRIGAALDTASWPWLFLGFVALVLVFPDGLLPGRRWLAVAVLAPVAALLVSAAIVLEVWAPAGVGPTAPGALSGMLWIAELSIVFGLFLAVLAAAAGSLVVRFRRGDPLTRLRVRLLMLAAGSVPLLLAASWVAIGLGAPGAVAYSGFLAVLLVLVPAAVTVAVLRHDLLDVDRLLGEGLAWVLTTVVSAGIFAAVVALLGEVFGRDSRIGVTGAAFVSALCLLPLHRTLVGVVGRVVDADRHVVLVRVRQFVQAVRDGSTEPEAVEDLLRAVVADPGLRVLLRRPGSVATEFVDLRGEPATIPPGVPQVPLRTGDGTVGVLVLGSGSARRMRRAREMAIEARLPIEVSRLRLELRGALDDVRASRARLAATAEHERRRLERDLHDGAQQQIVAVGMRLRSVQRRLNPAGSEHAELDRAVDALEATIAELRRLAHGVRPARLDDGLGAALRSLVQDSAVPVDLAVADTVPADVPDLVATTIYFVVAESLTNAHKHAGVDWVGVRVERVDGVLRACIRDHGPGGATEGFGITALRDRVASDGGDLSVCSPVGAGTEVRVEMPCAS